MAGQREYKQQHRACPTCGGTGSLRMVFGERVRAMRDDRGMSQEELSKLIGLTRSQVANMEASRSDPSVTTLIAVARAFAVTVDFLLGVNSDAGRRALAEQEKGR